MPFSIIHSTFLQLGGAIAEQTFNFVQTHFRKLSFVFVIFGALTLLYFRFHSFFFKATVISRNKPQDDFQINRVNSCASSLLNAKESQLKKPETKDVEPQNIENTRPSIPPTTRAKDIVSPFLLSTNDRPLLKLETQAESPNLENKNNLFNLLLPRQVQALIFEWVKQPFLLQRVCRVWKGTCVFLYSQQLEKVERYFGSKQASAIYACHKGTNQTELTQYEKLKILFFEQHQILCVFLGRQNAKALLKSQSGSALTLMSMKSICRWVKHYNLLLLCQKVSDQKISILVEVTLSQVKSQNFNIKEDAKKLIERLNNEPLQQQKFLSCFNLNLTEVAPEIGRLTQLCDLSFEKNKLTTFPEQIGQLTQLTNLDLSHNSLRVLPSQIGELTRLTKLFVSSNQLEELPGTIGQLTCLKTLNIHSNRIKTLPREIGCLINVTDLSGFGNELIELPSELGNLTKLTNLSFSFNQLKRLPKEIGKLSLKVLSLSHNKITELPEEIGELASLEGLVLEENELTMLPNTVGKLTRLTKLNLSKNKLVELPREVGQLVLLKELTLYGNALETLPEEVGHLTNLTDLSISCNRLQKLPSGLAKLMKIIELSLVHNRLIIISHEIGNMTQLKKLSLSSNKLAEFSQEMGNLIQVTELTINDNNLTKMPRQIGQLTQLTQLDLSRNQLEELPTEMGQMKSLTSLDLRCNKLETLPQEVGNLPLVKLDLGYNKFRKFPFGEFNSLEELAYHNNNLDEIPDEILRLSKLRVLDISYNKIKNLSAKIECLTHLIKLDISHNKMEMISAEIEKFQHLTSLNFSDNNLPPYMQKLCELIPCVNKATAEKAELREKLDKLKTEVKEIKTELTLKIFEKLIL